LWLTSTHKLQRLRKKIFTGGQTCVAFMQANKIPVDQNFYMTDMIFDSLFKILAIEKYRGRIDSAPSTTNILNNNIYSLFLL